MDTGSEEASYAVKGTERGPGGREEEEPSSKRSLLTTSLRCPWEWQGKGQELKAEPSQDRAGLQPGAWTSRWGRTVQAV